MFSLLGNCYSLRKNKETRNVTLIILGFDNAGKTTTVRDLQQESKSDVTPSLGFSNVSLKIGRINITLFDVGGGPTIRDIWGSYYADVHGFVYVVDSTDLDRLKEVSANLRTVLSEPLLMGKPCLILANKQDKDGALSESSLAQILDLENLASSSSSTCRLELCSALQGQTSPSGSKSAQKTPTAESVKNSSYTSGAVKDGFRWLVDNILTNWEPLNERVVRDVQLQKEQEQLARKAKAERIRKLKEERERKEKVSIVSTDGSEKPPKEESVTSEGDQLRMTSQQKVDTNKRVVNSIGGEEDNVSDSHQRMMQFAGLMHELGPDLNKSFSESLRSNRSVSRKKKKNRDKTTATADELGRGADDDNEETSTKKSSASISPRSGHVSSDLDTTLDESSPNCHHAPHSQRNGYDKLRDTTDGATNNNGQDENPNNAKEHRLLPPLIDKDGIDESSNNRKEDKKKKKKKKYRKNQLAPMEQQDIVSATVVTPSARGGSQSVDSGMVPDDVTDFGRPEVCSPRNEAAEQKKGQFSPRTNLVLVTPSGDNDQNAARSQKVTKGMSLSPGEARNEVTFHNRWTTEDRNVREISAESEKEDSAGTLQSEVVRYQSGENHRQILKAVSPNQQEKEEEALPIELQTYISSNGGGGGIRAMTSSAIPQHNH